ERGSPRTATGQLGTARLAALVPAARLGHVTAAAYRAERGSPRTATGHLGSHDFRSFHRSPRRPRACGNSGASRLARFSIISPLVSPPSCLRQLGGVSARTTLFRVVEDHAQRGAGSGGEAADDVAHGDALPPALAARRPLPPGGEPQPLRAA